MSNVQSLPESGRAVIRKKVYAPFKSGRTKYADAMKCHEHERRAGRWYAKFAGHAIQAIHGRKHDPKPGGGKHKLSDLQLAEWKRIITDRTPDQLKFKLALWSSRLVKELVACKYGAQISRLTARRYMQKIFLIVDNLKVHPAKYLAENLESRSRMPELSYLPSFPPELNPDDYLNRRDLKAGSAEQNLPPQRT